jgi:hypothetical protein
MFFLPNSCRYNIFAVLPAELLLFKFTAVVMLNSARIVLPAHLLFNYGLFCLQFVSAQSWLFFLQQLDAPLQLVFLV